MYLLAVIRPYTQHTHTHSLDNDVGVVTKYFDFNLLIFVCASFVIVSLAPQVLLARDGALAAALCSGAGDFSLLPHVALLLAHCYHRPHGLSNLFTALGNDW